MNKIVYAHDPEGRFIGPVTLDESDLSPEEPGVFLVPGNCLESAPPPAGTGQEAVAENGYWTLRDLPEPEPSPEPAPIDVMAELLAAVQGQMDLAARSYKYDSIASAITYRGDPNPKFAAEAEAFFLWRSAVWTKAYEVLATGDIPTIPEAIAMMPPLSIIYPEPQ